MQRKGASSLLRLVYMHGAEGYPPPPPFSISMVRSNIFFEIYKLLQFEPFLPSSQVDATDFDNAQRMHRRGGGREMNILPE